MIEKTRSVVTDGEGRYNIVDLRPGTYSVTFTLPGFRTLGRDGIELTAGFTATVGGDMSVGALEEAITVTGAAPLVDTSNTRKQTVVSSDLLNVLPSSVKNLNSLVSLTPGFRGNEGFDITGGYTGSVGGTYHGKTGTNVGFDGMQIAPCHWWPGLQPEPGDRAGNGALDQRDRGRHQCRRRDDQHGAQGGRQPIHRLGQRPVLRLRPAERQPGRRTARARPRDRDQRRLHL